MWLSPFHIVYVAQGVMFTVYVSGYLHPSKIVTVIAYHLISKQENA